MLDSIILFTQLVEASNFTAASEKLNIPPSTLSRKIKELESYFNTTLLVRNTRNMKLTEHGHLVYSRFKDIRNSLDDVYKSINQINNEEFGELNISMPIYMPLNLITPYLNHFANNYPNIKINCIFQATEYNIDKNKLDIIITHDKIYNKDYNRHLIRKDFGHLYCTPQYIEKYGLPLTISELEQHNFIGLIDSITNEVVNQIKFIDTTSNDIYIFDNIKNSQFRINSINHILKLGLTGEHIFGSLEHMCEDLEKQGKLVKVLPNYYAYEYEYCIYSKKKLRKIDNDFIKFIQRCMNGNIKQDILNI
jgi:DNA-binding transcriptional LysR family regulator